MTKQQREELLTQAEMFLGMGLVALLVAALNWHGNVKGGWGSVGDWIGRLFDSLVMIIAMGFMLRKTIWNWPRRIFVGFLAVLVLWIGFAFAAIALSYWFFFGVFILFLGYSVLLCLYHLWSNWKGSVSSCLDKVVNTLVYARQILWLSLLWLGTILTWSEIRNHVKGLWPDIVLVVCVLVVGILTYAWLRGIWQDRNNIKETVATGIPDKGDIT